MEFLMEFVATHRRVFPELMAAILAKGELKNEREILIAGLIFGLSQTFFVPPTEEQQNEDTFEANKAEVEKLVRDHNIRESMDTEKGCRKIYLKLALLYHPDKNKDKAELEWRPQWLVLQAWWAVVSNKNEDRSFRG